MNKSMKHFLHLLRWDCYFLFKYQLFAISLIITFLYWLVFQGMKDLGGDTLLMLVLYNDPVLLGMLFGGLMLIMDRNQFTVGALATSPLAIQYYILSKLVVLTVLGLILSVALFLLIKGHIAQPFVFVFNVIFISSFFTLLGFWIGLRHVQVLPYIIQLIGLFMFLVIPFLGYFNVVPDVFTVWMPLGLSLYLFEENLSLLGILFSFLGLIAWNFLAAWLLFRKIKRFGWA